MSDKANCPTQCAADLVVGPLFELIQAKAIFRFDSWPTKPLTPTVGRRPQKLVQVITFDCPVIIKSVCFRK